MDAPASSSGVHSGRVKDKPDTNELALNELDFGVIRDELATQNSLVDRGLPNLLMFGEPTEE